MKLSKIYLSAQKNSFAELCHVRRCDHARVVNDTFEKYCRQRYRYPPKSVADTDIEIEKYHRSDTDTDIDIR